MSARSRLYIQRDIYNHSGTDALFLEAVRDNVTFHKKHCPDYCDILQRQGFDEHILKNIEALAELPVLPTAYLKKHHLSSMAAWRLPVKATSSGTTGLRSQLGYNARMLGYAGLMTVKMAVFHKLLSHHRTNYLMLGYEPAKENRTVIVKTQGATALFAPPKEKVYALKYRDGGYEVDYQGLKRALERYAADSAPVRLIGYPSYMLFLLQELAASGLNYRLPEGSMVLLGGGWKGFYKEQVEKQVLYEMIGRVLGIPQQSCREFFGVAEHPVLYCSCPHHHFHIPNYSRVIIRDAKTLQPLKPGEIGLVNLLTPVADSMPLTSIMTDDLGCLREGTACGCGISTPYLEIIGRIGMKEIQTCAVKAEELLKGAD